MPLVDPSGPQWIKDLRAAHEARPRRGIAAFFERLFTAIFGWLR